MAQLENTAGQGGLAVAQGDVSVSRSTDGGVTWSEPVTVFKGQGAGIGPANNAKFYDKEWLTCDNSPTSRFFGRCYVTTTLFQNGLQGSFVSSDIFLSWSDDGGRTWTDPRSIAVTHPSCTFQTTGPEGSTACDENQFSIPETAPTETCTSTSRTSRTRRRGRPTSTSTPRSWSSARPTAGRASARQGKQPSSRTGSLTCPGR